MRSPARAPRSFAWTARYDDAVRVLQDDAAANGWTIISDTAWPGYERIPFLIMLGYTRMMDEVSDSADSERSSPSHVFVQGGVGGLLCAIASWCAFHRPDCKVISVEPDRCGVPPGVGARRACRSRLRVRSTPHGRTAKSRSLAAGIPGAAAERRRVHGDRRCVGARGDARARRSLNGDGTIAAGASGAAALGGLLALCRDER